MSARHIPTAAINIIMANGKALTIEAVCNALKPPASKSVIATKPDNEAQNTRCQTGLLATPPDANESTTKAPESADVTKNVEINKTAMKDTTPDKGNFSSNWKSATA